jgi:hypothetical protein
LAKLYHSLSPLTGKAQLTSYFFLPWDLLGCSVYLLSVFFIVYFIDVNAGFFRVPSGIKIKNQNQNRN